MTFGEGRSRGKFSAVLRVLTLAVTVACVASCDGGSAPAPPDAASLPEATYVELAAEAECARLAAGDPPSALDAHLAAALDKRGLARDALDHAARRHPGALARIDEKVASCRAASGWTRSPSDASALWEKLPR